MLPQGKYAYKFVVDNQFWIVDTENEIRENEGYNGFNSALEIN